MSIKRPRLSLGLITDLHYAPTTIGTRHCSESLVKLKAAVEAFKSSELDLIVCLGDVIDASDTIEEEIACIKDVRSCLDALTQEKHFVLGNHDVSELTKGQFLTACGAAKSYYSFDSNGVHLIILDSNFNADGKPFSAGNFHWSDAWIGTEQIDWLKDDLDRTGDKATVVFCHAGLDHRILNNGRLNGHIVRDAPAVRAVLENHGNVKAVIQGHDHKGAQSCINGIPYLTLSAMVEGSGPSQNAFGVFHLLEDGEFLLNGFGRQPSFDSA